MLLTLNAGSSSIKFALFDAGAGQAELSGLADALGPGLPARLRIRGSDGEWLHDVSLVGEQATHDGALAVLLAWLDGRQGGVRVDAVGHRIVHGGANFTRPVRIDDDVLRALAELEPLAPLHQPHNLAAVRAAFKAFTGVPQVACFDTAFHATMPDVNRRFALPRALHDEGVRRYGFHGLSYESIVAQLEPALASGKVVVAHLGNGASLCAIDGGRSVATTMSFSPLDGLTMGTRCGQLDAAVVLYLLQAKGMNAERIASLLYRESGLRGLSGLSNDMRELQASDSDAARQAIDHFVERIVQGIGTMAAALRGIDALVFTGGIGENAASLRARVLQQSAWLGVLLDEAANRSGGPLLTRPDSAVSARVLRTDEEAVIARHTARLLHL